MAWCFSTRALVATELTMRLCVSRCLRVKTDFNAQDVSDVSLSICKYSKLYSKNMKNRLMIIMIIIENVMMV